MNPKKGERRKKAIPVRFTKRNKKRFNLKQQYEIKRNLRKIRNPSINKAVWNSKRKKWVHPFTQKGYFQPTVREVFINLKDENC